MITWLFDNRNQYGYLPNLVKDKTLQPGTSAWHDLCIKEPYSYEFRFLKYCALDRVPFKCALVNGEQWEAPAYYPVNLNFFDPDIDYFSLMDPLSLQQLQQGKFKFLFYYSEGDDIKASGIEYAIKTMMTKHAVSLENVVFVTANAKMDGKYPYFFFPDDELYYRYLHIRTRDWVKQVQLERKPYKLTYLNRADKVWRRVLASRLQSLGCLNDAQFSYTGYQYETSSIEEDSVDNWSHHMNSELFNTVYDAFSLRIPYTCDDLSIDQHNDHKIIHTPHFTDSYWQLIAETHFHQDTVFLTEKTFKCILNLQPFVLAGSPQSLYLLRKLGYQTFDSIVNEDYDKIQDPFKRMDEVINIIYSLNDRSHEDHVKILTVARPIMEHNQQHFLKPKVGRIHKLLTRLDYT